MLSIFRADLHLHSKYSRATSKHLTPAMLAAWGAVKGLQVLGSGDCTHKKWREELREQLLYDDNNGLYRLKKPNTLLDPLPAHTHVQGVKEPFFMIQGEISCIYKKDGKVRKNHNLVFVPTLEAAEKLSTRLARIGNLESDGRPILGLDARHLLEIVLETDPTAFLVPAHIWTPWFSLFGSKSGFDSINDCFEDLTSEIFALETGLSSDPEMNRRWSHLDAFKLISNSDAHSGEKLGREATLFQGTPSYMGIYQSLQNTSAESTTKDCRFLGSLEFFPEEGKYHLDGHRACRIAFTPEESTQHKGLCPVCNKPLTLGVLYRVQELADRDHPFYPKGQEYVSLIPLAEIISELVGTQPRTKKVHSLYTKITQKLGPELDVLQNIPLDTLTQSLNPIHPALAEAIQRMRQGNVIRNSGFDGEYGTIHLFTAQERKEFLSRP